LEEHISGCTVQNAVFSVRTGDSIARSDVLCSICNLRSTVQSHFANLQLHSEIYNLKSATQVTAASASSNRAGRKWEESITNAATECCAQHFHRGPGARIRRRECPASRRGLGSVHETAATGHENTKARRRMGCLLRDLVSSWPINAAGHPDAAESGLVCHRAGRPAHAAPL
jgi:hypothetical protein